MPFDPTVKRTEATVVVKSQTFKVTKGAPHVILKLLDEDKMTEVIDVSRLSGVCYMYKSIHSRQPINPYPPHTAATTTTGR